MASKRILQIAQIATPRGGGVQTYMANLSQALEATNSQVFMATVVPSVAPSYPAELAYGGSRSNRWLRLLALRRWLLRELPGFDVVHIHKIFLPGMLLAAWTCWRLRRPYCMHPHGRLVAAQLATMSLRDRLFLHLLALPLMRRAHAVVVTSPNDVTSLRALDARLPVVMIPPGVPQLCDAIPSARSNTSSLRLGFVGRLAAVKNLALLIEAIQQLTQQGYPVSLEIIGDDEDGSERQIRSLIDKYSLQHRVILRGRRDGADKLALMQAIDVFAFPSLHENFCFGAAEALCLGKPVLVSDQVGLANIIEEYRCGQVLPLQPLGLWVQAIKSYLSESVWQQAHRNALRCADQALSLQSMSRALLRLYQNAQN